MSNQLISDKKLIEKTNRRGSDFLHLIFASVNFLVMFVASLDFFKYLVIFIALTGISSVLYILFIYYWKIRNQFYVIFNYGSTMCSLFIYADLILWSFQLILVSPIQILLIFILVYFIYLLTLIKNFGTASISRKIFISRYGFQGASPQKVDQMWHDDSIDTFKPVVQRTSFGEKAKFRNTQVKLHKVKMIMYLTLIFTSSFLIIHTFALMN